MNHWMHELDTTVLHGLPVIVHWSVMGEDRPQTWDCPAEYQEIQYEVCDRTGRAANWIESRMTADDHQALLEELQDELDGMKANAMESLAENMAWERRYA